MRRFGGYATLYNFKNTHGGVILLELLHGCFLCFLNCTNGTNCAKHHKYLTNKRIFRMPSLNFFFSFARIFPSHWYHANVMRQPNSKLKRTELNEENFAHRFEKTNKDQLFLAMMDIFWSSLWVEALQRENYSESKEILYKNE